MSQINVRDAGINFIVPNRKGKRNCRKYDCYVHMGKDKRWKQIGFTFYNNVIARVIGKSEYITFGLNNNKSRVYFLAVDADRGFKPTQTSRSCCTFRASVPAEKCKMWESWEGYYYLRYDDHIGCYYIDKNERVNEG